MKTVTSAGAVIFTVIDGTPHVLMITDMNGSYTFPKGVVERGEELMAAAEREAREETGITGLTFRSALTPIRYTFTREGTVRKTVHYFLFTVESRGQELKPQREEGITDVRWLPLHEAASVIGYPRTNGAVLSEARERMELPL